MSDGPTKTQRSRTAPAGETRKKIEHVTERGDWTDPFSGLVTHYANDRNPESGAVRDGDEAVLTASKGD